MFKNYEEYIKAFNTEDKREEAILLLGIQNWIIQFIQNNKIYDDYYYNLDNFLNSKWINNENKKSPHSNKFSIGRSQLRISFRFWNVFSFTISRVFDLPKLFDCNHIDSKIHKSRPPGKKSENRPIISISQRPKIRSNNFGNHKTK